MSETLQRVKIFISSPGDVSAERRAVVKAVQQLNLVKAIAEKYHLVAQSYDLDATPMLGQAPQTVIDETMGEAKDAYLVVVVIGARIGQPFTHPRTLLAYESGTVYEYATAYESLVERGSPQILIYRKLAPPPAGYEGVQQPEQVEAFFNRVAGTVGQSTGLYASFTSTEEFERLIFRDIQVVLEKSPPTPRAGSLNDKLETIQSKRIRLHALRQAGEPAAAQLASEIRRELRHTLSPLPFQRYSQFVGRQEHIDSALRQLGDAHARPIIAIDGIGGVGKTALAYEIAKRALETDGLIDAVVWESDKPDEFVGGGIVPQTSVAFDLDTLLNSVGSHLGFFDVSSMTIDRKKEYLKRALNEHERYLLVIDNLDTIAGYNEVVFSLGQVVARSKVLLTTRYQVDQTSVSSITLTGLNEQESLEFLRAEARSRGSAGRAIVTATDDQLRPIWEKTDGMPLAMKLIVGQITRTSLAAVLNRLEDVHIGDGNNTSTGDVFDDFYRFIYQDAWERMTDAAQAVMFALSSYDPTEGARYSSLAKTVHEDLGVPTRDVDAAIADVVSLSLATRTAELDEPRYFLHPLTRNFIRSLD